MKRFYRAVEVAAVDGGMFAVHLDAQALRSPARQPIHLPRALAEAVAAEWREQPDIFEPSAMALTKCINSAIDHVAGKEETVIAALIDHADLLCHRATDPALAARQGARWDPLLDALAARHGVRLTIGVGVGYIRQSPEALAGLRRALRALDMFRLTALHGAASLLGSLVLALALAEGWLDADDAFAASRIDEDFQAEHWGRDDEADARARALAAELASLAVVMRACR